MADKPAELPKLPDHVISAYMPDETRPLHTLLDQIKSLSLDFDTNTPKPAPGTSPPPATETPGDALDRLKAMFEATVPPPPAREAPHPQGEPPAPLVEAPVSDPLDILDIPRPVKRLQREPPIAPKVVDEPAADPISPRPRRALRWASIGVPVLLLGLGVMMPGHRPEVAVLIPPVVPPPVVASLELETQAAPAPAEPTSVTLTEPTSVDLAKPEPPANQALFYIEAGDEQISNLDIDGARSNFWKALQASLEEPKMPALGTEAAIRLGATYDASFLKRARIKVKADAAKAKFWYRWAGR